MSLSKNCINYIDEANAAKKIEDGAEPFATLFQRADLSIELFSPCGIDTQTPHERDEIYIISSGRGSFSLENNTYEVTVGDFLFVPAGRTHHFFNFTQDFRTWVIFFGPAGGVLP